MSSEPSTTSDAQPSSRSRIESMLMRLGTVGELLALMSRGGRWWMVPLVLVLAILGFCLVLLHAIEYVAPFIYVAI